MNVQQYLEAANENVLVMVQIETKEAVEKVREIAEVDGIGKQHRRSLTHKGVLYYIVLVDVLFIGPYDLSISLGYPPPSPDPHPHIEQVIQKILKEAHDAGKKW